MLLQICLVVAFVIVGVLSYYLLRCLQQLSKLEAQFFAAKVEAREELEKQQALKTELANLEIKLTHDLLMDPLTGLPGRKVFEDRLALTLKQSQRYQLTCSVMFLDLDGFKVINEALGHDVGDELLKAVSERLQTCVRQVDTVSRFAGDEFVFIFAQIAKAETAAYLAQRLLDSVAQPFIISGQELYVTASVGVAIYPLDGADGKALLKNADNALHQAKSRGRNTYQFYREEMHAHSRRELILTSSLRNDTIYQDFHICYQPQVNVVTKQVVCMEALLEWHHPDFGVIGYEDFARLAENGGRIFAISEWLLKNVCHDLLSWRQNNFFPQAILIKISLKQLENPRFVHKVSSILQEMNLDPACLVFEVGESSLLAKSDMVEKMLHMMKHLGVQITINNFGTNNLALHQLRRLPIDIFKIDNSLIKDITVNKESEALVKIIIALAKSLQASVVAEGVESPKQKQLLQELGCQVMQGNLFSVPHLANEFTPLVIQSISQNTER